MTIDLGFAWLTFPSGTEASIVDVPGHERFVKNMLAGAAGIDVALLVIAADEGVMPQTREHLDILDLLDVRHGVVALTKADLAEPEWLSLVREDVIALLRDTTLQGSAIVPVSSLTGTGVSALLEALDQTLVAGPPPRDLDRPFVPVDRVFSVAGFGTVVTGTLHDGSLAEGMELEIVPGKRKTRLRTLQSHRARVPRAEAGARVALNLQGISADAVVRSDIVAPKGSVLATSRFDAHVRVLASSPLELRHGMQVSAHLGAAERSASLTILGGATIEPGSSGWVQFRLHKPIAATRNQRLVIRLPSPVRTIAGGVVVDVSPRHRRSDLAALQRLQGLISLVPDVVLLAALDVDRPSSRVDAAFRSGLASADVAAGLERLMRAHAVLEIGARYITQDRWRKIVSRTRLVLESYHASYPLRRGMPKEELRRKVEWRLSDWPQLLHALIDAHALREVGPLVALPDHGGGISSRQDDVQKVISVLTKEPYAPPNGARLRDVTGADDALLNAMCAENEIVRVEAGLYFARDVYADMVLRIVDAINCGDGVTVAEVRDMFGTSRKYALALLEHLDDAHVTRRSGDVRTLGGKAPSHA